MIGVDANVLARLLLRDDEQQYRRAVKLFADGRDYTAPPTVILELVWVLGSYGYERQEILFALRSLLGLPNFKPKHAASIHTALTSFEAGMDFGDALHLAMSSDETLFVTFDERLAKRSARSGATVKVELV